MVQNSDFCERVHASVVFSGVRGVNADVVFSEGCTGLMLIKTMVRFLNIRKTGQSCNF